MTTIAPIAARRPLDAARPPAPSSGGRPGLAATLFVGVVVLVCVAILLLTGQPVVAAAPVLLIGAAVLFWKAPVRHTLVLLMGVYLVVSIPPKALPGQNEPGQGWKSPVYPLYSLLSDNLSKVTHIEALRFSGMELFYLMFLGLILVRVVTGNRVDAAGRQPGARAMYVSLAIAFFGVLWLEVWGIARGGDFRQSLWQFRNLMWLPVLVGVFGYCMRDVRDFRLVAVMMTVAAWLKIMLGLHYMMFVAWPNGQTPESMTGHEDSVLYVAVLIIWFATWMHHPTWRTFVKTMVTTSLVLTGLVINNRRIAFVSLLAGLFLAVLMLKGPLKRRIVRTFTYMLPVICLYLLAGRNRSTGIFKPASLVMSVSQQKDASSKTRDIENYNLIQTLKPNKLLGTGWGHEYNEVSRAYDISMWFAQYRYIAHNSILWLISIGGIVGFTLIWLPVSVTIFLASRSYRFARTPYDQTVAASVITVMVTYVVQAWGDMGTQGLGSSLIVAAAMAASAKLAHATGAWPAHLRLFGAPRVGRTPTPRQAADAMTQTP